MYFPSGPIALPSSSDGYAWGFLSQEAIIGKAIGKAAGRFWPPNRVGGLE